MTFNFHKPFWRFYVPEPTAEQKRHRAAMIEADGMVRGNKNRIKSKGEPE